MRLRPLFCFALASAVGFTVAACDSGGSGSKASGDTSATGLDAADAADGVESTDSASDGADSAAEAGDATDGGDSLDGVDGEAATDSAADSSDGAGDSTDAIDGADSADSADGTDGADATGDGPPAPKKYSGAVCPSVGKGKSDFASLGAERSVVVTLPKNPEGAGVLFIWHGFGDTNSNFSTAIGAQGISDTYNVITIAPLASIDPFSSEKLKPYESMAGMMGPMPPTWSVLDGPDPDLTLFDDLLSCLSAQYQVDLKRVYTFGFSQGALFSTRLVMLRSETLASAVLWSGGLGSTGGLVEVVRFEYEKPTRAIPLIASHGGEADSWPAQLSLVNFMTGTDELVTALRKDGHAVVECNHDLGHTIPNDGLSWAMPFMFDHEWTREGDSPYFGSDGKDFPAYCTMPE